MNIRRTGRRASDLALRFEATRCRTGVGRERERPTSREPACLHTQHASVADRWMVVPVDARPIHATGGAYLAAVSIAEVADLGPAVGAVMPMDA